MGATLVSRHSVDVNTTHGGPNIDVLSNTLNSSSLVEVSSYYAFSIVLIMAFGSGRGDGTYLTISQSVPHDRTCIF